MTCIDWLMILGYFALLGGVVWWSMRRNKIESGEDLFLGGLVVGCVIAAYAYFWTWLG